MPCRWVPLRSSMTTIIWSRARTLSIRSLSFPQIFSSRRPTSSHRKTINEGCTSRTIVKIKQALTAKRRKPYTISWMRSGQRWAHWISKCTRTCLRWKASNSSRPKRLITPRISAVESRGSILCTLRFLPTMYQWWRKKVSLSRVPGWLRLKETFCSWKSLSFLALKKRDLATTLWPRIKLSWMLQRC